MANFEEQLLGILQKCEVSIKELAEMNGSELDYIEDDASEFLDLCHRELHEILLGKIPELLANGTGIQSLSELARASDIFEFCKSISPHEREFPFLFDFSETFDDSLISWEPLHSAIRNYFSTTRIAEIASSPEVELALIGFEQINKIDQDFLTNLNKDELLEKLELLRKSEFLTYDQVITVNDLRQAVRDINIKHLPIVKKFEGSTGGLEPVFLEWIEETLKSPLLSDIDLVYEESTDELDANLELLKEKWLARDFFEPSSFEGFVWEVIAVNSTVDIELEEKTIYVVLNQLCQITQNRFSIPESAQPETMEKYKLTLFRTGEREEYDSEMDINLLALQTLTVQRNLTVEIENIESEIDWIRLGEKDFPLLGLSKDELDSLSQRYLDAQ